MQELIRSLLMKAQDLDREQEYLCESCNSLFLGGDLRQELISILADSGNYDNTLETISEIEHLWSEEDDSCDVLNEANDKELALICSYCAYSYLEQMTWAND